MNRISIKYKIVILVFSVIVSITLLQTNYIFRSLENEMHRLIEKSLIQKAIDASQRASTLVELHFKYLNDYTKTYSIQELKDLVKPESDRPLQLSTFCKMNFIDVDRKEAHTEKVYDAHFLPYYNAFNGRRYLGKPQYDAELEKYIITFSVPVYKDNIFSGVLIGYVDSKDFSQVLNNHLGYNYDSSYAYIADSDGDFIAHHDHLYVEDQFNINDFGTSTSSPERKFNNLKYFFKHSIIKHFGIGSYLKNNSEVLVSFCKIDFTNWRVYFVTNKNIAFASVTDIKQIFIVMSIIATIISLLAALVVASRIANPLIRLSNKFIKASKGDLSVRADHVSNDEIGVVSQNFNQLMSQINQLTFYDALTTLPNSNVLMQDINYPKADTVATTDTLALISIDRFTRVNEIYGMEIGDKILIAITRRLKKLLKDNHRVYKGRGDEFFIVFQDVDIIESEILTQKIIDVLCHPYIFNGNHIALTLSIGLVHYHVNSVAASQLMNNLTHANILSKANRASAWNWYSPNTHQLDKKRAKIETKLFSAIKNNEFHLVYQPIFSIKNKITVGAEALIRWNNTEMGAVSTEHFIAIAEENGFIKTIDRWVFETACQQLCEWKNAINISVNVSAITFEDTKFIDFIDKMLKTYPIEPQKLHIELTERIIMNRPAETIEKMNALNQLGIRFALDDFGTGYSSMNYLFKLPIEIVKIDRSFVNNIGRDLQATAIVNAIINMCQEIGLSVLAEGVETLTEVNYLSDKDCTLAQGYFYDKPLMVKDFEKQHILETKTV